MFYVFGADFCSFSSSFHFHHLSVVIFRPKMKIDFSGITQKKFKETQLAKLFHWRLSFQGSPSPRANGDHSESRDRDSIGLNGDRNGEKAGSSKLNNNDRPPSRSGSSSSRSTPNLKTKDVSFDPVASQAIESNSFVVVARQAWHTGRQSTFNHTKRIDARHSQSRSSTSTSWLSVVALPKARRSLSETSTRRLRSHASSHRLRPASSCSNERTTFARSRREAVSSLSFFNLFTCSSISQNSKTNFSRPQSLFVPHERRRHSSARALPTWCTQRTRNPETSPTNQHSDARWGRLRRHNIKPDKICVHRWQGMRQGLGHLSAWKQGTRQSIGLLGNIHDVLNNFLLLIRNLLLATRQLY